MLDQAKRGYQYWYAHTKNKFNIKAIKAVATEVDKKWLTQKANEINRLAYSYDKLLAMPTAWVARMLAPLTYSTGLQLVGGAAPKPPSLS